MRKLGEAFYGRAKSYDSALAGPGSDLQALVARTLYADNPEGPIAAMVDYIERAKAGLSAQPIEAVMAADLTWPGITA